MVAILQCRPLHLSFAVCRLMLLDPHQSTLMSNGAKVARAAAPRQVTSPSWRLLSCLYNIYILPSNIEHDTLALATQPDTSIPSHLGFISKWSTDAGVCLMHTVEPNMILRLTLRGLHASSGFSFLSYMRGLISFAATCNQARQTRSRYTTQPVGLTPPGLSCRCSNPNPTLVSPSLLCRFQQHTDT